MLYANELIELMSPYPGRDFRMVEIVRYVAKGREMTLKQKRALRKGVLRAIEALRTSGCVLTRPSKASRGGFAKYRWNERRASIRAKSET